MILKDTETIDLDFGRMEIDSITIGGRPAYFEWTPQEVLTISLAGIPSHATVDLQAPPPWSEAEVRERMSGNICRCGAYSNIHEAIQEVAGRRA